MEQLTLMNHSYIMSSKNVKLIMKTKCSLFHKGENQENSYFLGIHTDYLWEGSRDGFYSLIMV